MTVAFVFPGQGAQKIGMGASLCANEPAAKAVFDEADEVLGEALSQLCFLGPDEQLRLTRNTQPAILATSIAAYRALGVTPSFAAGHSLGEYSALVAAGVLTLRDALVLVRNRGEFMQAAVPVGSGAMAAVLKLGEQVVVSLCKDTEGVVEAVNFNSPGQIVIAGETAAVAAVAEKVKLAGGRAMPLPVSAPFHCQMMRPAEEQLRPLLESTTFRDPQFPVVANVNAKMIRTGDEARANLILQVSRPVLWEQSVRLLGESGVRRFVEVGPGTALSGMIKRTLEGIELAALSEFDELSKVKSFLTA